MSLTTNQEEQEKIIKEVIDFVINAPTSTDFSDKETPFHIPTPPSSYVHYTPIKCFEKKEKFEPLRTSQSAMKNCSRSEDPYLELVNEAIYGNLDNHPKEGSPDYYKAAECFAIYGKGFLDVLKDPGYHKESSDVTDLRPPSKPLNPYAPNVLFPKENEFSTPLSLATYPNIGASAPNTNLVYPFQPTSQYAMNFGQTPQNLKIQQMAKSLYKNAVNTTALNAAQQILFQANQQTNYNQNIMSYPFYPALNQPLLYANPMLASSYFNAWVKETQINTAIFQQQHYNVYENNMLIYAQMLQQTQKITQTVIAANKFHKQLNVNGNLVSGIADMSEGEASTSVTFTEEVAQSTPTPPIKILTKNPKESKSGPGK